MSYFEERTKTFLDKNKNQIKLIQNILNTYKLIGNISIENYKNIKKFCKFNEFKFILPGSINKKKEYIENFSYNQLIHERAKKKKGKKCCKSIESELNDKPNQITKANDEIILLTLNGLNELYQINKIENESKIKKAIEFVLNEYLSKNVVYDNDNSWYKIIIKNNFWEIINYLPNI